MKTRYWLFVLLIALGPVFVGFGPSVSTGAQPLTHTVEKGDTLWDICEKYYEDPDLWPKLWQMNPFITNPHLLNPGDVITLLEDVPIKKMPPAEQKVVTPAETIVEPEPVKKGIDVSGMVNVEAMGFLSSEEVAPSGRIFSDETERIILSTGDTVYVDIEKGHHAKAGDLFTVYRKSPLLEHPQTGKKLGCGVSFLGRLVLKEKVKESIYKAEIDRSYKAMREGDLIFPYEPISPCVEPLPLDRELTANIVAVKDQHEIIGQFSVVYLGHGLDHGINRGNLFAVVRKRQSESLEKAILPDVVLGHVLVLKAQADTATGVVTDAKEEFFKGAHVSGLDREKARLVFSSMPECTIE